MIALVAGIAVLAAGAIALQLAIPRIAAGRVRAQLTRGGGRADVRIRAFPATTLLRNAGQRIEVRGSGLEIGLGSGGPAAPPAGLSGLDGFPDVDIELVSFRTGPFAVDAFVLERSGGGTYALAARARAGAADIARLGASRLPALPGVPGAGLLGSLSFPSSIGATEVPLAVEVELESSPAGLRVLAGGGSIAGYPAGRIAAEIAAAVARRLEIVP